MKYMEEFRDPQLAAKLSTALKQAVEPGRDYRLMEFCGGHTHAIFRYGIQDLMPDNVQFIHGPGCPVCVLPSHRIDSAIALVETHDVILCTYADLMRVPAGKRQTLLKAKAAGGDIRMLYSSQDALQIARDNPHRQVVFFAIGFETTTPATAVAVLQAQAEGLENFSVYCNHVLTPAALTALLASSAQEEVKIDGFFGPSHVSSIIGSRPYEYFAEHYQKPVVIAGFEPLDMMQSALMLVQQINEGRYAVENEYGRAVTPDGNQKAKALMEQVFEVRDSFEWRGLGHIENSALKLKEQWQPFDAESRFQWQTTPSVEVKSCACPQVLRGQVKPTDCTLFATTCTPENPMGSCMVSSEGACAAYYSYGRYRTADQIVRVQESAG